MTQRRWLRKCLQLGLAGFLGWLGVTVAVSRASAQNTPSNIVPDNTLGTESSRVIRNFQGRPIEVITGGATRGINLFHSLREFNVREGRGAYFFSPSADIQNILARVTGGNRSEILGVLGTFGESQPNLFLINPNGILFGRNASLDVQGSFVATTANAVQFGGNGLFSATNPQAPSQLLTINPSAFLFNQINQSAAIENQSFAAAGTDPAGFDTFGLQVPDGKSLLLVGGNVSMDGGELNAYGGRVELGGLAGVGTVNLLLDGNNLRLGFPENVARADVSLTNQASVLVNGIDGGAIAINARNLEISEESGLFAGIRFGLGTPSSKAGNIDINATEAVNLTDGSYIYNTLQRTATGKAGNININAGSVNLESGSVLSVSTYGKGDAGNIFITASGGVSLKGRGTEIFNDVEPGGVGNGGEINIKAGSLTLSERAQIEASVISSNGNRPAGQGSAGSVNIDVRGTVSLLGVSEETSDSNNTAIFNTLDNGSIGAGGNINIKANSVVLTDGGQLGTSTFGRGDAGNVSIQALDGVSLDGGYISSLVSRGGVGNGGNIFINSRTLTLNNGAQLQTLIAEASDTQSAGRGNAGQINIDVRDRVTISGTDSTISSSVNDGAIGNGGDIDIKAGSLFLSDNADISASTLGQGDAGNITLRAADSVTLTNARIFSNVEAGAVGNSGNIDIRAASFSLFDTAQLITGVGGADGDFPAGQGNAGNVNVNVTGAVTISGIKNEFSSAIYTNVGTGVIGNGGNVTISSGSLSLADGAKLVASTSGTGFAGNIFLSSSDSIILTDASILSTVEAGGVGNSGNIKINAASLSLFDALLLTRVREAQNNLPAARGNAGNVNINVTGAVKITSTSNENGNFNGVTSEVQRGAIGNGGNITISSGSLFLNSRTALSASTYGKGDSGSVFLRARDSVSLLGDVRIFSIVGPEGVGKGGNIDISANSVTLQDYASLVASTYGRGSAGDVIINAKENILFDRSNAFSTVEPGGVGNGGKIAIAAGNLTLNNGSRLETLVRQGDDNQPAGRGNAGSIDVDVRDRVNISGVENDIRSGFRSFADNGTVGNGGNINIKTGSFIASDRAEILASIFGKGSAGNIFIDARENVQFDGANAYSTVGLRGDGKGGDINITAGSLFFTNGAEISTATFGIGAAGSVILNARENILFDNAIARSSVVENARGNGGDIRINTDAFSSTNASLIASTFGRGNAGNVVVNARDFVSLVGKANIFSSVEAGAVGDGGSIDINAASLSVFDGSSLVTIAREASGTLPAARGNAGNVNINVAGAVTFSGSKDTFSSGIISRAGVGTEGRGGDIKVTSGSLSVLDGAILSASTFGEGNAGNIIINAKDNVLLSGNATDTSVSSGLYARTEAGGVGGNIDITTGLLSLKNSAQIAASSDKQGDAGDIVVRANRVEALDGGQIQTTTFGSGGAGTITVNAKENILISGRDAAFDERLAKFPEENSPNVGANSGFFVLSTGSGTTGDIEITSPRITLDNQARINAESASGNGGNIEINASDLLLMRRGAQISTNAGTAQQGGDGGNININSRFIVAIPKENSDISANAFTGTGGRVEINSQGVFGIQERPKLTPLSDITASSEQGVQGVTAINAPDTSSIENSLTQLPENSIDTNALIANSCIARNQTTGTFYITGTGGLPESPGNPRSSNFETGTVRTIPTTGESSKLPNASSRPRWKIGDPIVEPQGVYKLENGQMVLSRECPK